MKVLCFGSLNIDNVYSVDHFVRKGETLSSLGLEIFTGGKGLNQSVALAKAGAETYHAGSIGPDGQFLLETMKQAKVHTEYVSLLPDARTGNAIIQRDREGDNCILLYGGTNQMITEEQVYEVLSHFEAGDYLVLQNEINNLPCIVRQAHDKGMVIVLNPSPMDGKILQLPLKDIDILMLNEIEAGQILNAFGAGDKEAYPSPDPSGTQTAWETVSESNRRLASALRHVFPDSLIVLTLGSDGSGCIGREGSFCQPIYKVPVADTTAAGDTYTGYFIAGLIRGRSLQEAMKYASAASAIAVSREGAAPSIPAEEEVERFLAGRK